MTQAVGLTHAEARIQSVKSVNPWEIAAFLSDHAIVSEMKVRVWLQDCLCILLETHTVLDRSEVLLWLQQKLAALELEGVKTVRVYARAIGQHLPAWREDLDLQSEDVDLSALQLFNWLQQGNEITLPLPKNEQTQDDTIRFLRFAITSEMAALFPLSHIQKVLKIPPDAILPVPQVPRSVLGVYNYRSEILWLVDFAKQLGVSTLSRKVPDLLTVIVLHHERQLLGLVVPEVVNIEMHPVQQQQPPIAHLFPATLSSFLQGYLLTSGLPILNAQAVIRYFSTT